MSVKTQLLPFQTIAADNLFTAAVKALTDDEQESNPRVRLEGPCGSGKTVILTKTVLRLLTETSAEHPDGTMVLFLTPNKAGLLEQSHRRIKEELSDDSISVLSLVDDDVVNTAPRAKTVITANYEALYMCDETGGGKNKLTRDSEDEGLFDFLRKATAAGIRVILVMDEAHYGKHGKSSAIAVLLHRIWVACGGGKMLRVEATATPSETMRYDRVVKISRADAVNHGLLRERFVINAGRGDDKGSRRALARQNEVFDDPEIGLAKVMLDNHRALAKVIADGEELVYNPLMLVCVNNANKGSAEIAKFRAFFEANGIRRDNGKLKVWTFADPMPYDELSAITEPTSGVEVLIIKMGPSLGWDCPRAQSILVSRAISGKGTFTDQLLGRCARQVYGKKRPRGQEIASTGYIYADPESAVFNTLKGSELFTLNAYRARPEHLVMWSQARINSGNMNRQNRDGVTGISAAKTREMAQDCIEKVRAELNLADELLIDSLSGNTAAVRRHKVIGEQEIDVDDEDRRRASANLSIDAYAAHLRIQAENAVDDTIRAKGAKVRRASMAGRVVQELVLHLQRDAVRKGKSADPKRILTLIEADRRSHPRDGTVAKVLSAFADLVKAHEDATPRNTSYAVTWTPYTPAESRLVYDKCEARDRAVPKKVRSLHLYGDTIRHPLDSAQESDFETTFLEELCEADEPALVSWFRNTRKLDGYGGAFSLGFPEGEESRGGLGRNMLFTHADQMFPDYMLLMRRDDGSLVAVAVEVKAYKADVDGPADRGSEAMVTDKIELLRQLTSDDPADGSRQDKGNAIGAVVYQHKPGGYWMACAGNGEKLRLRTWLSRHTAVRA